MYYTGYAGGTSSTGAPGVNLFAYTATFGNGFSATLSIEDGTLRRNAIWDAGTDALAISAMPGPTNSGNLTNGGGVVSTSQGDYAASQIPDIVGALRVDQAWGSAQISAALHQVRAGYFGNNTTPGGAGAAAYTGIAPADKWGYAVMGGIVLNLPWSKGDQFWVEAEYTVGATAYTGMNVDAGQINTFGRFNGGSVAATWALDSIFGNTGTVATPVGSQELTTAWAAGIGVQHYWTPALRTSVFGLFTAFSYDAAATAMFCSGTNGPVRTVAGGSIAFTQTAGGGLAGCNPNWNNWAVGSRTIWNPVANLDIGVEILYSQVNTNFDPSLTRLSFGGSGGRAAGLYTPSSEGVWSGVFRVQRNFWP
jgi:hypothetical protein